MHPAVAPSISLGVVCGAVPQLWVLNYIIVDLEATCWEVGTSVERQEIIEIGAVRLREPGMEREDTFARFVRPALEPRLTTFCTELTGIRQQDIEGAPLFAEVFAEFVAWIGLEPFRLVSWGAYDLKQFAVECDRQACPLPATFSNHLNLKAAFGVIRGNRPCGMAKAMAVTGLLLEGRHHRALDDAMNIAKLAAMILPALGDRPVPEEE
jgi:inhibitor of KinA sporulation pathway (predicted exonuclease)